MKPDSALIRVKRYQLAEKRRRVAQIEAMIADFERMAADLDREIVAEQARTGIHDPAHFAYPTYAKAAIVRRDNLKRSASELIAQLRDAKAELQENFDDIQRAELLTERDQSRDRAHDEARLRAGAAAIGALPARNAQA